MLRAYAVNEADRVIYAYLCAAAERAWKEIIELFERKTGIRVVAVYGSSGRLLAQIAAGAPADVYAPASPRYIVEAVERGLVSPETVRPVAFLIPVVAVPKHNPGGVGGVYDLARPDIRLAFADRRAAIGFYAFEVLSRLGLTHVYDRAAKVDTFTRLAALVATGAIDATIAWHVIAYWYPDRVTVIPLPREYTTASWIPIAVVARSKHFSEALAFVEFVTEDPEARAVLEKMGYIIEAGEALRYAHEVESSWLLAGSSS
jgi:molybdate transport system substrate-binding protein